MSISRAWVGNGRSLLESYFDTHTNRAGKNSCLSKTTTDVCWKAELQSSPRLLCVIQGLFWAFLYHFLSPSFIRPGQLTWPGHLICFSQSTSLALEKHLFHLHFQTHSCGLQIARDSIWATEMSRAILNLISVRWGSLSPKRRPLTALQWLQESFLSIWIATRGKRLQRKQIIYKHHDQQLNPYASDWKSAVRGYQLYLRLRSADLTIPK